MVDSSSFLCLQRFFFLSRFFLFDVDSDNDRSVSWLPGTCTFPFFSGNYVGRVSGVGSGVFVPTGIKSIGDVVPLVLFVPIGVDSKVDQLIEILPCSKS